MRYVRYMEGGVARPGVLDLAGTLYALPEEPDLADLSRPDVSGLAVISGQPPLAAPIKRPGKFLCIGLNYRDHARETGAEPPKEPFLFQKATSAFAGPNDALPRPPGSSALDWEVELGVVIGKEAWQVPETQALSHVAGYVTFNDVSERDWQKNRGGQFTKGKSGPCFGPVGPWLVPAAEVGDPQKLWLKTWLNGDLVQDGTTAEMIFPVSYLVHYLSQFMVLEPGDVIATGTPAGVGLGMTPPRFLTPGDMLELEVEGLGRQHHAVI